MMAIDVRVAYKNTRESHVGGVRLIGGFVGPHTFNEILKDTINPMHRSTHHPHDDGAPPHGGARLVVVLLLQT